MALQTRSEFAFELGVEAAKKLNTLQPISPSEVRLKPDTTYATVRLKADTTYATVRLKADTTYVTSTICTMTRRSASRRSCHH